MPDIKLKGWSGAEWEHKNVPKVWLNAPESTEENPVKVPFTYGEAVHKNIDPDFSAGNMNLAFPEGELVTSLTVNQPPNLLPENIPKGMYIAGVGPGEFEGGEGEGVEIPKELKPYKFFDPYGEILYAYTKDELLALTELPPGPTLSPLTFGGWSHTLEQIKSAPYWAHVAPWYKRNGNPVTVLILDVTSLDKTVSLCITQQSSSYKCTVDWGDGSTTTNITGSSTPSAMPKYYSHTYSTEGIKVVTIERTSTSGTYSIGDGGYGSYRYGAVYETQITTTSNQWHVKIPSWHLISVLLYTPHGDIGSLAGSMRLKFLGYGPSPIQSFIPYLRSTYYTFLQCTNLKVVAGSLPVQCNQIGSLYGCTALKRLWVYNGTLKDDSVFCEQLREVIYNGQIGTDESLNSRWAMLMIAATPPTISVASPKWGTNPIYVPDEAVDAYKAADKWSSVADYIFPASQYHKDIFAK